jgi:hypothetical protein
MEKKNFIAINSDTGDFSICQAQNKTEATSIFLKNIFLKNLDLINLNWLVLPFGNCLNENQNNVKIEIKTVYKYDELTEEQKEKVLSNLWYLNVDHEWWDYLYDEAKELGFKITSFDIDHGYCIIKLIDSCWKIADKIIKNHGETCETYINAQKFLENYNQLVINYSEDKEQEFDDKADELEKKFKIALQNDYLSLLKKEYKYLTSKESIEESIKSNEYKFDENGKIC